MFLEMIFRVDRFRKFMREEIIMTLRIVGTALTLGIVIILVILAILSLKKSDGGCAGCSSCGVDFDGYDKNLKSCGCGCDTENNKEEDGSCSCGCSRDSDK